MLEQIFKIIDGIAIYDWKKLIKYFQSKKLYNNLEQPSKQNVLNYLKDINLYNNLTNKQLEIIKFELNNIYTNYYKLNLEKKIFDYIYTINELKQQSIDYRKKVNSIDSDIEKVKFEKFTKQWGEIQEKILFLSNEVRKFKKLLE